MEYTVTLDPSLEQRMRIRAVELAVNLTLKDEALFAGGMLEYADRIYKFINTGELINKPLKD
jgi:hypothetical protein